MITYIALVCLTVLWLVSVGAVVIGHRSIEKEKKEFPERFTRNRMTGELER